MIAAVNDIVSITSDGRVLVRSGRVELGQGVHTALAQIVADELSVAFDRVQMLPVSTAHSPDEGVTSGSLSISEGGRLLREACAALRQQNGLPAPQRAEVGRSQPRADLPGIFAGRAHFIHDIELEGTMHGRVLHAPPSSKLEGFDEATMGDCPGLVKLLRDGDLIGVVCETSAQADAALTKLQSAARWQAAPVASEDAEDLQSLPATTRLVDERTGLRSEGSQAPQALAARYTKPWIAHASLAPSCAIAQWQGDAQLSVWSHSQGIFNLRRDLALALGIDVAGVTVTHAPGAGCYGHNGADDVAFDAAWLARAVPGRALRVQWSRADELSHAPMGPAMVVQLQADVAGDGDEARVIDWQHDLWSPGHSRRPGRSSTPALLGSWALQRPFTPPASIDMPIARGGGAERNAVPGYDFAQWRVQCHSVVTRRRSSALRSLGAFANVFAAESFIDEIAHATRADPLALRRTHLQHDARALAVLDAVATRGGWATRRQVARHEATREEGVGFGLGFARYKGNGAWCAVLAEVHAAEQLRVRRLSIAVDVGSAVNPDGVVNQIEGGAIQATSWTLKESAQAAHCAWADYPILRFSEVPRVDVHVMPSTMPSLGAGEAAMGPTAAAIANALFDALGVRVRSLPLTPEGIIAAMNTTTP